MSLFRPCLSLIISFLLAALSSAEAQEFPQIRLELKAKLDGTKKDDRQASGNNQGNSDEDTQSNPSTESRSAAEKALAQKGVKPTFDGLKKYLNNIHISDEQQQEARRLVGLLGSEDYQVRHDATRKLSHFPGLPIDEFERAKKNADMETIYRIEMVAKFLNASFGRTLSAAYQVIAEQDIDGLLPELIRSEPFTRQDESLVQEYLAAVISTAVPADDQDLRKMLQSESAAVQAAAISGLYQSQKQGVSDLLVAVANDQDRNDLVQFRAAEALADLGNRESLKPLVRLLESSDVNVRTIAGNTLQIATNVDNGFTGYAKDEQRSEAVAKWKDWLANKSTDVKIRFPLSQFTIGESFLKGNTLLACGYANKVIELSPDGKEVWSVEAKGAWSAERLENGDTLVACYNQNKVVQFNPAKEEVWSYDCKSPLNVRPVKNGNVLISEYSGRRVIEVNRKKEIVWSYSADASVADAVRLKSGNTLVAAQSKVVEVDPSGKVVWEYATTQPYGIQALKSGNILIAKFSPGQILEVNRKKEIVWQYDCKNPTDAMQLPNGNILVTENKTFKEVTRDKEVIWTREGASCGAARR